MENLISGVKGVFAEQRLRLGEGADTKYYNYAGMISICGVFLNIRNFTSIAVIKSPRSSRGYTIFRTA
jgi:hypothetical protein